MLPTTEFIKKYSAEDNKRICFTWNGKRGDEFRDDNYKFRQEVAKAILDGDATASGELLSHILLAEADLSREIWGATLLLREIGTLLLSQTKADFVDAFFEAKGQSFDTDLGMTCYEVPKESLVEIISQLQKRSENEPNNKDIEAYIAYFSEYFDL